MLYFHFAIKKKYFFWIEIFTFSGYIHFKHHPNLLQMGLHLVTATTQFRNTRPTVAQMECKALSSRLPMKAGCWSSTLHHHSEPLMWHCCSWRTNPAAVLSCYWNSQHSQSVGTVKVMSDTTGTGVPAGEAQHGWWYGWRSERRVWCCSQVASNVLQGERESQAAPHTGRCS